MAEIEGDAVSFEVFIGWDPRERLAWTVACASLQAQASFPVTVHAIWRQQLEALGIYRRAHSTRGAQLFDDISDAPCATEFSLARFGVPLLARQNGWALFVDVDFLFRADVWDLYRAADRRYAVMVVKHRHEPEEDVKMDAQAQTRYPRKNWSSCVLWNMQHAANQSRLSDLLNTWNGARLHGFEWLRDEQIGELPEGEAWNWLDGHSSPEIVPKAVHFTRGTPDMPGYEHTRYASEWNQYAKALMVRRQSREKI